MTHEQEALWQRIRDHKIDAPDASLPYSARLAREQGWTPAYAARVVEEYRRFAFLAVASGHGATPSKAVDEAWHLHLLYTRNYWEEFCPHALGRPLHHHPADGGGADEGKYEGWYVATLDSYERMFGEPPPADVWPRGQPSPPERRRWLWLAALLPFALAGCDEPLNPLDWHGRPFLGLFAALCAVCFGLALALRYALRTPAEGPPADEWRLHPYDQATLNEGPRLALATALARLAALDAIEVVPKTGRLRARVEPASQAHPLDRAILRATGSPSGAGYEAVRRVVGSALDEIEASLRRQGLWMRPEDAARASLLPGLVASLPLLLGGAKILVGLSRERPVGFLVVGCVAALILNLVVFRPPQRSRYGDAVLDRLRQAPSLSPSLGLGALAPDALALSVALYGVATLAGTPYAHLRPLVQPAANGGDGGGGGDGGSSCGGSSCGGGGCGGGCGGCGS